MRVCEIIKRKEHLTPAGFRQIVAIKASMNLGLSEKVKSEFTEVVRMERPKVETPKTIDPN